MKWLAQLKVAKDIDNNATKPTEATEMRSEKGYAGSVASMVVSIQEFKALESMRQGSSTEMDEDRSTPASHEGSLRSLEQCSHVDRWCWPRGIALNARELNAFAARLSSFTDKRLALAEMERLADQLVLRDRQWDDRRLCLECLNLRRSGSTWVCAKWQLAGLGSTGVPADLAWQLQRCDGFEARAF